MTEDLLVAIELGRVLPRLFYALTGKRRPGAVADLLERVRGKMADLGLAPLAKPTRDEAWDLEAKICEELRKQGRGQLARGVEFGARLPPPTAHRQALPPAPQQRQEYLRSGRELAIPDDLLRQLLDRPPGSDVDAILQSWRGRLASKGPASGAATTLGEGPHQGAVSASDRPRQEPRPTGRPAPLRMLFLAANPASLSWIRLDHEIRGIEWALRNAALADRFEIKLEWSVRVTDLQRALLAHRPEVVHFAGHGDPERGILIEGPAGGARALGSHALGGLFAKLGVQCVVLNACHTAKQAEVLADHVDCVLGMTQALRDWTAITFATTFYQAIGFHRSVQDAFDLARLQVAIEEPGGSAGECPRLLAKRRDPATMVLIPLPPGGNGQHG